MTSDPHNAAHFTAIELLAAYRSRNLSPVEVTMAMIARIRRLDPILNTYALIDEEGALAAARRSEQRWIRGEARLLEGIPVSVKDNIAVAGMPIRRGSRTSATTLAPDDAPSPARLREVGAVILGKTTLPEFAWTGVTDSPLSGITRNAWDPTRTPGGSSGGAASGLAAGLATLAIGTDGGGSIRIPASYSGVFGLKPTQGLVGAYPPNTLGTLSHVGPMTRSVADAALMLSVMARPDIRNWTNTLPASIAFESNIDSPLTGLRLGIVDDFTGMRVDDDVRAALTQAAHTLERLGARIEPIAYPFHGIRETYFPLYAAALFAMGEALPSEQHHLVDPGLREVMAMGAAIDTRAYLAAMVGRENFGIAMAQIHEQIDALLMPTMPTTAFPIGDEGPWPTKTRPSWLEWNPFTFPLNLTMQPAASIPCGVDTKGLPIGLQVIGRRLEDARVLQICRAFEVACPLNLPSLAGLLKEN